MGRAIWSGLVWFGLVSAVLDPHHTARQLHPPLANNIEDHPSWGVSQRSGWAMLNAQPAATTQSFVNDGLTIGIEHQSLWSLTPRLAFPAAVAGLRLDQMADEKAGNQSPL